MKNFLPLVVIVLWFINLTIYCQAIAFPGAEGFGKNTIGGRGGAVYHVTNLENSGSGSLREAVSAGNRTIVFDIGGTIILQSPLNIKCNYITIAGQTAPGDGITVAGYPTYIEGEHIIVRYVRFRCGDFNALGINDLPSKGNGNLKGSSAGALDIGNSKYVIIDHVSASWSMDEVLSVTNSNNVTVQYSIISEALNDSYHDKGLHGYGSLIRSATSGEGYTFYRNLYAHNYGRNPGPGSNQTSGNYETCYFDFVNNVIYGWGDRSGEVIDGSKGGYVHMNYIGNYAIANKNSRNFSTLWDEEKKAGILTYQYDNKLDNNFNSIIDGINKGWNLFPNFSSSQKLLNPWDFPEVPVLSSDSALQEVLYNAGASVARDSIDTRVIQNVRNNSGNIINSQDEVGGLPKLNPGISPQDTDQDGMPDDWETTRALNPDIPDDDGDDDNDGYTNLEEYLNSLVKKHEITMHIIIEDSIGNDSIPDNIAINKAPNKLEVYPNPSNGGFYIDLGIMNNPVIKIYNLMGNVVYQSEAYKGIYYVKDHGLTSGTYIIWAIDENKYRFVQKLIIQ